MAEKKISQATLKKSFRNWAYGNLTCFSQEHMQTFGYLAAMLPVSGPTPRSSTPSLRSARWSSA